MLSIFFKNKIKTYLWTKEMSFHTHTHTISSFLRFKYAAKCSSNYEVCRSQTKYFNLVQIKRLYFSALSSEILFGET